MNKPRLNTQKESFGYDFQLLFVVIFLCVFGLIMVYSSSYYIAEIKYNDGAYYFKKQLEFYIMGLGAAVLISLVPYRFWAPFAWLGYIVSVGCMVLTNYTSRGILVNGQKRWLKVTEGLSFQTAELVKLAMILLTAFLLTRYARKWKQWKLFLLILAVMALPAYLVVSNNLSSGFIVAAICCAMMLMVSENKILNTVVLSLLGAAVLGLVFVKLFVSLDTLMELGDKVREAGLLEAYQLKRIYIWKDPMYDASDSGYQVVQGLYAMGSGGIFGKGLGGSTQKLGFVPEASNDMIFTILCEELGLFGAVSLVVLYLFMLYRMLMIAGRTRDRFGTLLVVGVMAHMALQVVLHIAVVTNVIPNTGVTLPFISYGGTSSLFLMAEIGLVLSVGRGNGQRRRGSVPEGTDEDA